MRPARKCKELAVRRSQSMTIVESYCKRASTSASSLLFGLLGLVCLVDGCTIGAVSMCYSGRIGCIDDTDVDYIDDVADVGLKLVGRL